MVEGFKKDAGFKWVFAEGVRNQSNLLGKSDKKVMKTGRALNSSIRARVYATKHWQANSGYATKGQPRSLRQYGISEEFGDRKEQVLSNRD